MKNHEILLHAIKALNDDRLRVTIVGDGPLYKSLLSLIQQENLRNVSIVNEMSKDKLFVLIANSDCLIHPSLTEGLPNVVLESLAVGTPCLVSNIPAHLDLIQEGFNGYFFDPHNKEDLVSKIKFVLSNKAVLTRMRNNCIESVKKYSLDHKIDRYIEIYRELLSTSDAQRKGHGSRHQKPSLQATPNHFEG